MISELCSSSPAFRLLLLRVSLTRTVLLPGLATITANYYKNSEGVLQLHCLQDVDFYYLLEDNFVQSTVSG